MVRYAEGADHDHGHNHNPKTSVQDDGSTTDSINSGIVSCMSGSASAMSGSGSASAMSGSVSGATSAMSGISVRSALRKGKYSSASKLSPTDLQVKKHCAFFEDSDSDKAGEKKTRKTVNLSSIPSSVRGTHHNKVLDILKELPAYVSLPNGLVIGDTGLILGRCSRFSLFFKKRWRELVWVHCKPVTILIFRSTEDAQKWMNAKYLRLDEKRKLIKFAIDFDAMGVLNGNHMKKERNNVIPQEIKKYNMTDARSIRTKIDGSIRHEFLVERWSSVGTRVEVAFSSSDVMEVKCIRKAIRKCIKKTSKVHSKRKRSQKDEESTQFSGAGSGLSDATGTTEMSNSTYQLSTLDSYAHRRRSMRKYRLQRNRVN